MDPELGCGRGVMSRGEMVVIGEVRKPSLSAVICLVFLVHDGGGLCVESSRVSCGWCGLFGEVGEVEGEV